MNTPGNLIGFDQNQEQVDSKHEKRISDSTKKDVVTNRLEEDNTDDISLKVINNH